MIVAQTMIWAGAVWLLLAVAAQEVDHTPYFFGVSKALRTIFPIVMRDEPDPDLIEILGDIEVRR